MIIATLFKLILLAFSLSTIFPRNSSKCCKKWKNWKIQYIQHILSTYAYHVNYIVVLTMPVCYICTDINSSLSRNDNLLQKTFFMFGWFTKLYSRGQIVAFVTSILCIIFHSDITYTFTSNLISTKKYYL